MRRSMAVTALLALLAGAGPATAGIDLVTLPERDSVQLTIYNSADLTLVRDRRTLTLRPGENRLQFAWANTLIDPTSLELNFLAHRDRIAPVELSYPPRVRDLGNWRVNSEHAGRVPAEISFFTSGISWRAYYLGTLAADESTLDIACYVRADNASGEEYGNAQVRLVVGTIALLDKIADLARRHPPHGRPEEVKPPAPPRPRAAPREPLADHARPEMLRAVGAMEAAPREIIREGVSEYFLYTIDGEETIPDGWGKRLPAFAAASVPVGNTFRFEKERFGDSVVRYLVFKNDRDHQLGNEPLPDGLFQVFQAAGGDGDALRYLGGDQLRYIPVDQEAELNLGPVRDVTITATLMKTVTENFQFEGSGDLSGWDEVNDWRLKARNYRAVPARVEIRRNLPHAYWELDRDGPDGEYRVVDLDTVEFTFTLEPGAERVIDYRVRHYEGTRRERR